MTQNSSPKVKLELTEEEYSGMYEDLHATRQSSETVKVNREALRKILSDYSDLYGFWETINGVRATDEEEEE